MNAAGTETISLLWNGASGWDEKKTIAQAVERVLSDGTEPVVVCHAQKGLDIKEQARQLMRDGAQVLVAAGGDGTINAVASAVANTPVKLGVIPAGTLNHFARDLGIPIDCEAAAQVVRTGHEVVIDVGSVNGRIFINNSILGLYPMYRGARDAYESGGLGRFWLGRAIAVISGMIKIFWRLPELRVKLEIDGRTQERRTAFILIANNEHEMEGWHLGRRACINKGQLWIYLLRRCSRWTLLKVLGSILIGTFSKRATFDVYKAREVHIETRRKRIGVAIDGEVVRMKAPLEYKSVPGALRVIAPSSYKP